MRRCKSVSHRSRHRHIYAQGACTHSPAKCVIAYVVRLHNSLHNSLRNSLRICSDGRCNCMLNFSDTKCEHKTGSHSGGNDERRVRLAAVVVTLTVVAMEAAVFAVATAATVDGGAKLKRCLYTFLLLNSNYCCPFQFRRMRKIKIISLQNILALTERCTEA